MPLAPKKLSALSTQATLADDDLVTGLDTSAATPAAQNVNFSLLALANWVLAKYATVTQAEAEARSATTVRWWTAQRVGQAIAAGVAGIVSGAQHNWAGSRAPLGTDDNTDGYSQGSLWRWSLRVWVCVDAATNEAVWVELTAAPSLTNPMTTAADIIIGGTTGTPARLGIGSSGQVLKVVDGAPAWATDATGEGGGGGMTNPMTTAQDLIVGGTSGAPARLGIGTNGQVLKVVDDVIAWAADEEGEGGGASLPVNDTTALVKDPTTDTKQIRIDAGNVPDDTTVVLQSPGISAEVGTIIIERSFSEPIAGGIHDPIFIAPRAVRLIAVGSYVDSTGGTYPVAFRVRKNAVNQGPGPIDVNNTADGGNGRYRRELLPIELAAGDILGVDIVGTGAEDVSGSGSTGVSVDGTLVILFELVIAPSL
jgi:hypothetical protein